MNDINKLLDVSANPLAQQAFNQFSATLTHWQKTSGRHDLPWQQSHDPYRIWLSEIMLQQTQVQTVIPYYARFLTHYPTVSTLAEASLNEVLTLWAGLGYYARARNLHACAQRVVNDFQGGFPNDPQVLASLPGIGRSTAAAISAFAFGQRAAILDGNVKRVLCRIFGIEGIPNSGPVEKKLWALAEVLLPEPSAVPVYTQGLMDLGATCCTRVRANCPACPMQHFCYAHQNQRVTELPQRKARTKLPIKTSHVFLIRDDHHVWLERRQACGIWGGLLSLPEADSVTLPANTTALTDTTVRHKFTHFELQAKVSRYRIRDTSTPTLLKKHGELDAYPLADADALALPTPWRKLLVAEANSPCD